MKTYQVKPIDISENALLVLKTALLLDKPYSIGYLMRLLSGDQQYELRKDVHKDLETFGSMEGVSFSRIEGTVHFLVKQGLLSIADERFGTIEISETGINYMNAPKPLLASRRQLSRTWLEHMLYKNLRDLRREMAGSLEVAPYEIFNNYALHNLVEQMPETVADIDEIPATFETPEACKEAILEESRKALALKAKDEASGGIYTKAHSPSHQAVLKMFEEGCSLEEIAAGRSLKEYTVRQYLTNLHRSEQLDLRPWIEENVDEKVLHKGMEYFSQTKDDGLEVAHQSLGLDYDALHWCRFYLELKESQPMVITS